MNTGIAEPKYWIPVCSLLTVLLNHTIFHTDTALGQSPYLKGRVARADLGWFPLRENLHTESNRPPVARRDWDVLQCLWEMDQLATRRYVGDAAIAVNAAVVVLPLPERQVWWE